MRLPLIEPEDLTAKQKPLYDDMVEEAPGNSEEYFLPNVELLEASDDIDYEEQLNEVRRKAKVLEATFADFGFNIRVVEIETGPVIAQYEIELEAGLRLSKIRDWPKTWQSRCACPASASWPRSPVRTRSASKCPTKSARPCGCVT